MQNWFVQLWRSYKKQSEARVSLYFSNQSVAGCGVVIGARAGKALISL